MKPIQINDHSYDNDDGDDIDNNKLNNKNKDKMITIDNNNNNNNNSTDNGVGGGNRMIKSNIVKETVKKPILWAVGLLVYVYFILFQLFSNSLSSLGYNTISLNNKFLKKHKDVIRLIPNRLKNKNNISRPQIGHLNISGGNSNINNNNNNSNNNNNNNNSSFSNDKKSFNTLKKGYYKKNFIVFISIQDNDKSALNVFNRVRSMFDNSDIGLSIFETENKSDTYRISYRIQQTEFDGIVCVGDDNLIHDVINCIFNKQDYSINRHIPIGIIPSGKKNGFSNSLGITSPEMATKLIIQGNVNYIDIMSASPIRNTNQLSFPNSNNNINNNNNLSSNTNLIDIYSNNNNNNNNNKAININQNQNNLNNYNNIFFSEYKVYSILYIGWGAISFRDKFKPWNSNIKPWLLSSIYSKFSNFSLNNFASSLYFLPSPHFSNSGGNDNNSRNSYHHRSGSNDFENIYCSKESLCDGCKKKYQDYDYQGKRSSKDFSDWKIVEGISDSNSNNNRLNQNSGGGVNNNGITFFLAGNLSHISKNFKAFPYSHLSDGFLDLVISNQTDKKKLNQLIYDPNPSSDCLTEDPLLKTTYYCKTKEFILNVKNQEIPLSIDGELFDVKEFGSNTIKVQSHRSLCAIFS